jgi:hypothetical protein
MYAQGWPWRDVPELGPLRGNHARNPQIPIARGIAVRRTDEMAGLDEVAVTAVYGKLVRA